MTTEEKKEGKGVTGAITLYDAASLLIDPKKTAAESGKALLALPVPSRALAIAGAFHRKMDETPAAQADQTAEVLGRHLERALEETGADQEATLRHMIEAGDTPIVLAMVRGEAGEYSSTAEHLTTDLIGELFALDPDMQVDEQRPSRLITIAYTLICETNPGTSGINRFFADETGQKYVLEIAHIARNGDEDASEILKIAGSRGIPIPYLKEDDEEEKIDAPLEVDD